MALNCQFEIVDGFHPCQEVPKMKHSIFFFLLLFASPVVAEEGAPAFVEVLSSEKQGLVRNPNLVTAKKLEAMARTPVDVPGYSPWFVKVDSTQKETLLKHLLNAKRLVDPFRFQNCKFEPGIAFSFYSKDFDESEVSANRGFDGDAVPTILLCLNCDVWAYIKQSDPSRNEYPELGGFTISNEVQYFGDSKPDRKELVDLFKELFPGSLEFRQ